MKILNTQISTSIYNRVRNQTNSKVGQNLQNLLIWRRLWSKVYMNIEHQLWMPTRNEIYESTKKN